MEEPRERKRLKYTLDAGRFSPAVPPDDGDAAGSESDEMKSENGESSESAYSSSCSTAGMAASFQVIANTMLRMELAQLEMVKRREADRLEAQMRRAQLEDEITQMMLQAQSHIASFVHQRSSARKRKNIQP